MKSFVQNFGFFNLLSNCLLAISSTSCFELTPKHFIYTQRGSWLINFYNGSCEDCQTHEINWKVLTDNTQNWGFKNRFYFASVDCNKDQLLCKGLKFDDMPSIQFLENGIVKKVCKYQNELKDLIDCLGNIVEKFDFEPLFFDISTTQKPNEDKQFRHNQNFKEADPELDQEEEEIENNINASGSEIILTEENYSLTEEGPWFIKYYAPWCGHCQKLAPTWEILGEKMKGIANIGKVDCTVNEAICKKMQIRGYPSLKLVRAEKSLDYWGDRSLEALSQFIQDKFGKKQVLPASEIVDKITQDEVALIYYNPYSKSKRNLVPDALYDLDIKIPVYHVNQYWVDRFSYNVVNSPALLLVKDRKIIEYSGDLTETFNLLHWILKEQYPTVRIFESKDILSSFEKGDGLVILKLIIGSLKEERKKFRDIAEPILRREDSEILFGIVDATKPRMLRFFGLKEKDLSAIVIYDIKSKLFYSKNKHDDLIALNYDSVRDALQSWKKGELEGAPLDTSRELFTTTNIRNFFLFIILPISILLGLFYVIFNFVDEPEEETKKED